MSRTYRRFAAAAAAAAVLALPGLAEAQLSDRSGPITFTMEMAPFVEVVSHDPSFHNLTGYADPLGGVRPGSTRIGTGDLLHVDPPLREVGANTPFRISVAGLRQDGRLEFTNHRGDRIALATACELMLGPDPATWQRTSTHFDCLGSPVFDAAPSRWVLFHAYAAAMEELYGARAGVYTATIYIQIDAA